MDNMTPTRGYFSGPEGKVNAATWGALALGLLAIVWIMGGKIGDYLVNAADNTLHLAIVGGIILLIGAALVDPKKRVWYLFRGLVRLFTSWFIELDPIGIRKSYVERVQAKYDKFTDAVATIRGQLISVQRKSDQNRRDLEQQTSLFHVAMQKGDDRQKVILSRNLERLQVLDKQYAQGIAGLTKISKVVIRYQEICADTITDLKNDIKAREDQMAFTKSVRGINNGLMAVIKGLPEKDMYDEAGSVIDSQYDQTLGQFDNVLDMTKDILTGADLSDSAALDAAIAKFENTDSHAAVGKTTKADIIRQVTAGSDSVSTAQSAGDYSDLMK